MKKTTAIYGVVSHGGNAKSANQDNYYVGGRVCPRPKARVGFNGISAESCHVFAVFDGGSDRSLGFGLAKKAAEVFRSCHNRIKANALTNPLEFVAGAMFEANDKILSAAKGKAGVPMAMVTIGGGNAVAVNLGNCKVYLYRDGTLSALSHTHTEAQDMVDKNLILPSEAETGPAKHKLTQFLGMSGISPYSASVPVRDGDIFVLCTDGIADHLSKERMTRLLAANGTDMRRLAGQLSFGARERGAREDSTVVAISIHTTTPKAVLVRQFTAAAAAVLALFVATAFYKLAPFSPGFMGQASALPAQQLPVEPTPPIREFVVYDQVMTVPEPPPPPSPSPKATPKSTAKPKATPKAAAKSTSKSSTSKKR